MGPASPVHWCCFAVRSIRLCAVAFDKHGVLRVSYHYTHTVLCMALHYEANFIPGTSQIHPRSMYFMCLHVLYVDLVV